MRDQMRKKYQSRLNKKIRELNKSCEKDELWLGRFIFYQRDCIWERFDDNSGGILVAFIRAYDKKTGIYKDYRIEYAPYFHSVNWHLSMDVANDFIVNVIDVWAEEPNPRESIKNWATVEVELDKIMSKPWNFYKNGVSIYA